jgi:hypothetical protein
MDFVQIGSALSVRGFTRLGSSLSLAGANDVLRVGKLYVKSDESDSNKMKWYADKENHNQNQLVLTTSGGVMHGTWSYTTWGTLTSDRRVKVGIKPLVTELVHQTKRSQLSLTGPLLEGTDTRIESETGSSEVVLDLLRRLRPVSFRYKENKEAKFSRFGFIAQELEAALPSVVETSNGFKLVRYHDLISILALGLQTLDIKFEQEIVLKLSHVRDQIKMDSEEIDERLSLWEDIVTSKLLKSASTNSTAPAQDSRANLLLEKYVENMDAQRNTTAFSSGAEAFQELDLLVELEELAKEVNLQNSASDELNHLQK